MPCQVQQFQQTEVQTLLLQFRNAVGRWAAVQGQQNLCLLRFTANPSLLHFPCQRLLCGAFIPSVFLWKCPFSQQTQGFRTQVVPKVLKNTLNDFFLFHCFCFSISVLNVDLKFSLSYTKYLKASKPVITSERS